MTYSPPVLDLTSRYSHTMSPYGSWSITIPTPGHRVLFGNGDEITAGHDGWRGDPASNSAGSLSPKTLRDVLIEAGFNNPRLHEVMPDGSFAMRAYPVPEAYRQYFDYYQGTDTGPIAVGGMFSTFFDATAKKPLRNILPVTFEFTITALGPGQHWALPAYRANQVGGSWWEPHPYPFACEMDFVEAVIDYRSNNLAAGLLFAFDLKGPGNSPQEFLPNQQHKLGQRIKITLTLDAGDLVLTMNDTVVYRTVAAPFLDVPWFFAPKWEGGRDGAWSGTWVNTVHGVPVAMPADKNTIYGPTPWPAEVLLHKFTVAA